MILDAKRHDSKQLIGCDDLDIRAKLHLNQRAKMIVSRLSLLRRSFVLLMLVDYTKKSPEDGIFYVDRTAQKPFS